jgi:ubiquinone/menaquinone biosynthesis C-methylase UbiE
MTTEENPIAQDAYDELADTYAEDMETNGYNADIELPGTTSLIPDVNEKRILDAGCGTGVYTEWLLDHGAEVVGVDASKEMLKHATERVGDRAEFYQADLGSSLGFAADDEFDGVVSALVLGYVKDWQQTFSEFARLLDSSDVPYYCRPLSAIITPILETGFQVDAIAEPQPTEAFEEKRPERYEKESKRPVFLCLRAVKR